MGNPLIVLRLKGQRRFGSIVISATIDTRFLLVIEDKEHQLGKRAGNAHRVPLANRLELFRTLLVKLVLHSFLMVDQSAGVASREHVLL
jgi:hypothetical protein